MLLVCVGEWVRLLRCVSHMSASSQPWWARPTLAPAGAGLTLGGREVVAIASQVDTPLYLYDAARIRAQVVALRAALAPEGHRGEITAEWLRA